MSKFGIVYLITNLINGRRYVGLTKTSVERRWIVHCSDARCGSKYLFHKALRKYGDQNFCIEEVASSWDLKNLRELETLLIEQEGTMAHCGGYNLTGGGEGGDYFSPELKARLSDAQRNHPRHRRITFAGKTMTIPQWEDLLGFKRLTIHDRLSRGWTEEECITTPINKTESIIGQRFTRLVVIDVTDRKTKCGNFYLKCKCDCGNEHYATKGALNNKTKSCGCLNRELTIARNQSGNSHPGSWKSVRCIETGVVYPSLRIAAKETGCKDKAISGVLSGKQHTTMGLRWEWSRNGAKQE